MVLLATAALFGFLLTEMMNSDREREASVRHALEESAERQVAHVASNYQRYEDQLLLLAQWIVQLSEASVEGRPAELDLWADPIFMRATAEAMTLTLAAIPAMDHVRIFDNTGREQVRVQRNAQGAPELVAEMNLQFKGHRGYVQHFFELPFNTVGATRISLNEERGAIEVPHRPMVRLGIKTSMRGETSLLVINYLASPLLQSGHSVNASELFMVDRQGYFLQGGERFAEWQFAWQLGNDDLTLTRAIPEVARIIAEQSKGTLVNTDGLYSWIKSPLKGKQGAVPPEITEGALIAFVPWRVLEGDLRLLGPNALWYWLAILTGFVAATGLAIRLTLLEQRANQARREAEAASHGLRVAYSRLREEEGRRADLLAVVGHEVRSPIASTAMLAESSKQEWVEAQDTVRRLIRTTLNLLDDLKLVANPLSLTEGDEMAEVTAEQLMRDSLSAVAAVVSIYSMKVELNLVEDGNTLIRLPASRIQSVISNIIRNACLHSGGNEIVLSAKLLDAAEHGSASLQVLIEDNGDGIPVQDRDRLFGMFERGTSKSPGMGIGLHVVKKWLEELDGSVEYFESTQGGAGFKVRLPVVVTGFKQDVSGAVTKDGAEEKPPRLDGLVILLAEDDDLVRRMSSRLFERLGARVIAVPDGDAAVEAFHENSPDLVVTDNFMPRKSGLDLIKELRAHGVQTPIVACTAATVGQEVSELKLAGANAVISKPLRLDVLSHVLLSAGLRHRVLSIREEDLQRLASIHSDFREKSLFGRILRMSRRLFSHVALLLEDHSPEVLGRVLADHVIHRMLSRSEVLGFTTLSSLLQELQGKALGSRISDEALHDRLLVHCTESVMVIDRFLEENEQSLAPCAPRPPLDPRDALTKLDRMQTSPMADSALERELMQLMAWYGEDAISNLQLALDLRDYELVEKELAALKIVLSNGDLVVKEPRAASESREDTQ